MIRKRISFFGRVQGVGFRWKASSLASKLGLTGWVQNKYDGSVIMEIQGEEELIDRMIHGLNFDRHIDIIDMHAKKIELDEQERSFKV